MPLHAQPAIALSDAPHNRRIRQRLPAVDLIAFLILALMVGLGASVALGGIVLLLAGNADAAELERVAMRPAESRQGTLLFRADGPDGAGQTFAAPLLHTDVRIGVSGPLAHAVVRQTFRNPADDWFEGIYVFPLPDQAAVSAFRIRVGERVIEGEVKERGQAQAIYQQAKANGQRAALLDQQRPNLFTTRVANIGPRQEVVVEIEYRESLRFEQVPGNGVAGRYSLRFPMVVGPRYIPGGPVADEERGEAGGGTDQVPDAGLITPPVLVSRDGQAVPGLNPVTIQVTLDAGVPVAAVDSPYHRIVVDAPSASRRGVRLNEGSTPANRDFVLNWTLAGDKAPRSVLFLEPGKDRDHALLMLMPPAPFDGAPRLPREVVFVIDTSGSMSGESIQQARDALALALRRLQPEDRFNLIEFNSTAHALFDGAMPADEVHLARAARWVQRLKADGGTEMAAALKLALDGGRHPGRVRQVVFLTDGAVGNEAALFELIAQRLGDSRLFTVGIGSAPNGHFMTRAAEVGRGSFTYIGKVEEVAERMGALFSKLESPVVTDIQVAWPAGAEAEAWPRPIPDLYLGEPVVVAAALAKGTTGEVVVSGHAGAIAWKSSLSLVQANPGTGVGSLWARRKIAALMASRQLGVGEEEVRRQVIPLAIDYRLASQYTSFVAVDRTPVRPLEVELKRGQLPTQLPHGWDAQAVFGELPQTATDAPLHTLMGAAALLLAGVAQLARRIRRGRYTA